MPQHQSLERALLLWLIFYAALLSWSVFAMVGG